MQKLNALKSLLVAGLLCLGLSANANDSFTASGFTGSSNIGILSSTADPEIRLNQTAVQLNANNSANNLGLGLLRSIYGEYTNILCVSSGDKSCLEGEQQLKSSMLNGNSSADKVAGIFPRQLELSQMLANALMMFSTAVLMLQTVIFLSMFVVYLVKGSTKSSSIEDNYNISVGTVLRVLLSVVLVFPTTTGYSIGFISALQTNSLSTKFGDLVWAAALKTISSEQIEYKTKSAIYQQFTHFKNYQALNDTIADAAYCSVFMNNALAGNTKANKSLLGLNSYALDFDTHWLNTAPFIFGAKPIVTDGEIRINFGPRDAISSKDRALFRNYQTTSSTSLSAQEEAYFEALSETNNNVPANYCGRITFPVQMDLSLEKGISDKTKAKNAIGYAQAQAVMMVYDDWVNFFMNTLDFSKNSASGFFVDKNHNPISKINLQKRETEKKFYDYLYKVLSYKDLKSAADKNSRFIFYPENNDIYLKGFGVDNNGTILPNNELDYAKALLEVYITAADGKAVAGKSETEVLKAEINEKVERLYGIYSTQKVYDANNKNITHDSLQAKLFTDATQYGWISAGSWFSTLSGIATNFDFIDLPVPNITVPEYINNAFSAKEDVVMDVGSKKLYGIDKVVVKQFKRYYYPYGYSINNTAAIRLYNSTSGKIANSEQDTASQRANNWGISLSQWLGYDPERKSENQYVHPLLQLQSSGNTMMRIGEGILGFSQIMDILGNGNGAGFNNELVEATTRQITGNNPSLMSIDSALSQVLAKSIRIATIMGYILYFCGGLLAIYLPLLPTIYWVSGALTWAIGSFVNLVAISVMSIGIALSRGEEVLGQAKVGAYMLLENGLRPILQPIGGIAFIIFSGLFIPLSAFLMNEAYAKIATQSTMMTGGIIYVLISVGMQYFITIQCVQLINGLHQKAMSHISAQMTTDDQSERQAQYLGGIIQQGRGEARMMTGGGAMRNPATSGLTQNGNIATTPTGGAATSGIR